MIDQMSNTTIEDRVI